MNTNQSFPKELAAVMLRGTPVVPGLAFGPSIHVLLHGRAEAAVPAPAVAARPQLLEAAAVPRSPWCCSGSESRRCRWGHRRSGPSERGSARSHWTSAGVRPMSPWPPPARPRLATRDRAVLA